MTNYVSKCVQIDDWRKVKTLKGDLHSFEDSGIPLIPNTALQVIVVFSILCACLVALILPKERTEVHFRTLVDVLCLQIVHYVFSQSFKEYCNVLHVSGRLEFVWLWSSLLRNKPGFCQSLCRTWFSNLADSTVRGLQLPGRLPCVRLMHPWCIRPWRKMKMRWVAGRICTCSMIGIDWWFYIVS